MDNWEQLLISPLTKIRDAILKIDKLGKRIVIVVDENRRLMGTLTDGDIRRALIKQISFDGPVSQIMCKTPRFVQTNWAPNQIKEIMEQNSLLQLPLLNEMGRVVGVETLQEIYSRNKFDNPILLIAGGFGKRLHPLTENCPKPLLNVGDKPILELIIERFKSAGFHRFYISTHYLHDMIECTIGEGSRWGVSIRYIYEEQPLGTGGSLGLLPKQEIHLPLIMMNADLVTAINFENLLSFHKEHGGIATMCGRKYEHIVPYGVIQSNGYKVISIEEKPVHSFFINAGVYVVEPALIQQISAGHAIDMPTILEAQMSMGNQVNLYPLHEYWLDIGRKEDYKLAQLEAINL